MKILIGTRSIVMCTCLSGMLQSQIPATNSSCKFQQQITVTNYINKFQWHISVANSSGKFQQQNPAANYNDNIQEDIKTYRKTLILHEITYSQNFLSTVPSSSEIALSSPDEDPCCTSSPPSNIAFRVSHALFMLFFRSWKTSSIISRHWSSLYFPWSALVVWLYPNCANENQSSTRKCASAATVRYVLGGPHLRAVVSFNDPLSIALQNRWKILGLVYMESEKMILRSSSFVSQS